MPSNDRPLSTKGIADALRDLMRAYVGTLENARDRIIFLGGDCDSLDKMVSGDPALRAAREALEQPSEPAADEYLLDLLARAGRRLSAYGSSSMETALLLDEIKMVGMQQPPTKDGKL